MSLPVVQQKGFRDIPSGHIDVCQICSSNNLQQVIDMGFFAPCDSLLTAEMLKQSEKSYPLNLVRCRDCGLVQIDYAVDSRELFFPEYPYRTGITETLKKNMHHVATAILGKFPFKKGSLVIDIGSNDGTLLEGFKNAGMRVLGVEPTNIADIANANGIETLKTFFNAQTANDIVKKYGQASIITATNVFAHVNGLRGLMDGISQALADDGVFVNESHYQLDILNTLQYDSIYHEHLRFYLIKPLIELFKRCGFSLVDVERIPNYGGSIRVCAKKDGSPPSQNVMSLIKLEEKSGAYHDDTYHNFRKRVEASRRTIRSFLVKLLDEGKSIVGIGCPGRSATLLQYCGVSRDLLPYIAEQSTCLKLGMFTPNTHIPVLDEAKMFAEQPDYALMLTWHYAEPIIKNLRKKGLKSKIVVPLPNLQIFE